jgi:Tc toxin complex TcA C-terminal TcB-binding domain/PKD domain
MATIWVPLAMAEVNSQLRQFNAAIQGFADIITSQTSAEVQFRYWCEFIEVSFIRLLTLEAMLEKADAEYKAGFTVDDQTFPDAAIYHNLVAAQTYEAIMSKIGEDGQYSANVVQGRDSLAGAIQGAIQSKDTRSLAFRTLGKNITVPTISGVTNAVPGLDHTLAPHQSIAQIISPDDPRTTNPKVYAIALLATAKLEQIKAGFNYLGYPPDYLPPWRFSFLLDRARYFAEHAKNAERDYLNFLNNAEHEEFQEQSVAQNVEMEKSNVRIETARVDQAQDEVNASQASLTLANQQATDAQSRFDQYLNFDDQMQEYDLASAFFSGASGAASGSSGGPIGAAIGGLLGFTEGTEKAQISQLQRDLDRENIYNSMIEANLASNVAQEKLTVDQAGLLVAGLQRQAAILRHEFAIQNLNYLHNQTLNADQWFRIANGIRSVSDTYLHYAIEMAFLAQQAYNFESDKRLNVIRFDYDLSDVGSMLAADFLVRDLESLEEDLVVSQKNRLQEVRYVLSMAREFPETLQALADTGQVMFSLRLEQLERHFPGLLNLRISSVDVQSVALMDPTRASVELTHLGIGMVRLKSQPGNSPLDSGDISANDDWLPNAGADWPIKIHVSGPETAAFSGLSRQEAATLSAISANERAAFEGLPGASSWSIDMSMKENQVVPGTLADVIITFSLAGYHDSELKNLVKDAASSGRSLATTSFISARRALPDAFYSLAHNGKLNWDVSEDMLVLGGAPGALHNLAVMLPLTQDGLELGRCYCRYPIRIQISSGAVTVFTVVPELTVTQNGLTLSCAFAGTADVTWDFGDNSALVQGATAQHSYSRPGRYTLLVRLSKNGTLVEYRGAIVVSVNNAVVTPLIVAPVLSAGTVLPNGTVPLTVALPAGVTDVSLACSAGRERGSADSGAAVLNLKPGSYELDFLATRKLSAHFYGKQRYVPTETVDLYRDRIATNRTFDPVTGAETTTSANAFSTQLFGNGNVVLSPGDRWTLELPLAENPWFMSVSPTDIAEFDGGELADAILSLEFLSTQ